MMGVTSCLLVTAGFALAAIRPASSYSLQEGEQGALAVPEGKGLPVLLDGLFSPGEWEDAKRLDLDDNVSLFLKSYGGHVLIGVKISPFRTSVVEMFISPDGRAIHHLHASAQIGERRVNENSGPWDNPPFVWGDTPDWQANEIRWDEGKMQALIKEGKSEGAAQEMSMFKYDGFEFQIRRSKFGPGPWLFRVEVPTAPRFDKPVVFPGGTTMKSTAGWAKLTWGSGR